MSILIGDTTIVPAIPSNLDEVNKTIINNLDDITTNITNLSELINNIKGNEIDHYSYKTLFTDYKTDLLETKGANATYSPDINVPSDNMRINFHVDGIFDSKGDTASLEKMNSLELQIADLNRTNWKTIYRIIDGGGSEDKHLHFDLHICASLVKFRIKLKPSSNTADNKKSYLNYGYIMMSDSENPSDGKLAAIWECTSTELSGIKNNITTTWTAPNKSGDTNVSYWKVTTSGKFNSLTSNSTSKTNDNSMNVIGQFNTPTNLTWTNFSVISSNGTMPTLETQLPTAIIPAGATIRYRFAGVPKNTADLMKNENVFHVNAVPTTAYSNSLMTNGTKLYYDISSFTTNTTTAKGCVLTNNINVIGFSTYKSSGTGNTFFKIKDVSNSIVPETIIMNSSSSPSLFLFTMTSPNDKHENKTILLNTSNDVSELGIGSSSSPTFVLTLRYVSIGSGVTKLHKYAFNGCTRLTGTDTSTLTTLNIPSTVTTINPLGMFNKCNALTKIDFKGSRYSFELSSKNATLNMFGNCTNLTSVNILNLTALTTLSCATFVNCSKLKSLDLRNVKHINLASVFDAKTILTSIVLNYNHLSNYENYSLDGSIAYDAYYKAGFIPSFKTALKAANGNTQRRIDIINCNYPNMTGQWMKDLWSKTLVAAKDTSHTGKRIASKCLSAIMGISNTSDTVAKLPSHHFIEIHCWKNDVNSTLLTSFRGDLTNV